MPKKKTNKTKKKPSGRRRVIKNTVLRPDVSVFDERLLLPRRLVAKAYGVGPDSVGKWELKPVIRKGKEALYYLPEVISLRQGGDGTRLDPAQEKAKLDQVRREQAELALRKSQGQIVEIDEVCMELEKELVSVRQRLLSLPTKLARPIILAETPQEAQDILADAIAKALKDLNYGERINFAGQGAESKDAKAAAATKSS